MGFLNTRLWVKMSVGLCCREGQQNPFLAAGQLLSSAPEVWGYISILVTENLG